MHAYEHAKQTRASPWLATVAGALGADVASVEVTLLAAVRSGAAGMMSILQPAVSLAFALMEASASKGAKQWIDADEGVVSTLL